MDFLSATKFMEMFSSEQWKSLPTKVQFILANQIIEIRNRILLAAFSMKREPELYEILEDLKKDEAEKAENRILTDDELWEELNRRIAGLR